MLQYIYYTFETFKNVKHASSVLLNLKKEGQVHNLGIYIIYIYKFTYS